jgi:hypothetical protein
MRRCYCSSEHKLVQRDRTYFHLTIIAQVAHCSARVEPKAPLPARIRHGSFDHAHIRQPVQRNMPPKVLKISRHRLKRMYAARRANQFGCQERVKPYIRAQV